MNARLPALAAPIALVLLVALVLQLLGEDARAALRYERSAVLAGEVWRLISGNLVHTGWIHLGLNAVGLGLLVPLMPRAMGQGRGGLAVLVTGLAVGLGLLLGEPRVEWYVGLSGVVHGLAVVAGLGMLRAAPATGLLLLLGITGKLAWDIFGGGTGSEALIGAPVVAAAHVYGAAGALLLSPLLLRTSRAWCA